jgi:hypothetical protein
MLHQRSPARGCRGRGLQHLHESKRAEPERIAEDHVAVSHHKQFGAASADFDDDAASFLQFRILFEIRIDAHVGDAIDFRFVDDFNHEVRCDEDSVNECQAVDRFANCGRRDHTNVRSVDTVLAKHALISAKDRRRPLDRGSRDSPVRECLASEIDSLHQRIKRSHVAAGMNLGDRHANAGRSDVNHCHGTNSIQIGWRRRFAGAFAPSRFSLERVSGQAALSSWTPSRGRLFIEFRRFETMVDREYHGSLHSITP